MFSVENPRIIDSFEKAPLISRGEKKLNWNIFTIKGKYNIQKYIKITLCLQNIIRTRINRNHKNTNKMIAHIRKYITPSKLQKLIYKFY